MIIQPILIADSARARIFVASDSEDGFQLSEWINVANPEAGARDAALFRGSVSRGRASRAGTGTAHGLDDGRKRHRAETARKFAKDVAAAVRTLLDEVPSRQLIVIAEPRFLGVLRPALRRRTSSAVRLVELAEELSWRSTSQLQRALVKKGLLRPREVPPKGFRPRGQLPAATKRPSRSPAPA